MMTTDWAEQTGRPTAQQLRDKAPAVLAPEDFAENERSRKSKRGDRRQRLAVAKRFDNQRIESAEAIAKINERKEIASAEHVTTCAPLQARLKEIESLQIAAIKAQQPTDPTLDSERTDLLNKIRELNESLKANIEREDRLIGQLETERVAAAYKSTDHDASHDLLHALANPALKVAWDVAASSVRWAQARLGRAQEQLQARNTPLHRAEAAFAAAEVERTTQLEAAAMAAVRDE